MNEKDMMHLKSSITMPAGMADALMESCNRPEGRRKNNVRYSKMCVILAVILCTGAAGSTSLAYNVYQEKQLAVFMDTDLTQEEIAALGSELDQIPDISSYRYISGDEAWADFQARYFSGSPEIEALGASFEENPLADSFNYQVSIRMSADTEAVRNQISRLHGVRKITTIREAKKESAQTLR